MNSKIILNFLFFLLVTSSFLSHASPQEGLHELQTGMKPSRPTWSLKAFLNLPKVWGKTLDPEGKEFKAEIQKRYGLFYDVNFPNDGLPVGITLTYANYSRGEKGITLSCQACHGSKPLNVINNSVGNVFFDYQALYHDLEAANGTPKKPFFEVNPLRNSIVSNSNYMARLGIFSRNIFPMPNYARFYAVFKDPNADNEIVQPLKKELPYRELVKTQSWVNYQYKKEFGLLVDASSQASPAGTHYMTHFTLDPTGGDFIRAVRRFDRVVPDYFKTLTPPVFPKVSALNKVAVLRGAALYEKTCASCHGSFTVSNGRYALTKYPGKLIPREILGTDTLRIDYRINYDDEVPEPLLKMFTRTYKYIAPPLVGVWARAPYLHNGSVPNLRQLLEPGTRVKTFAIRSYPDVHSNYDEANMGWKFINLDGLSEKEIETLKNEDTSLRVYVPNRLGMTNTGHLFGEKLSFLEKEDLLEFLKSI